MCLFRVLSWRGTAVSLMLGVARHPQRGKETAVLDTLPRAGGRLQSVPAPGAGTAPRPPDAAQVADAVARFLALREFRARLYGCLTARADALFELCDAILCADHAVTSLVQLSLVPEFRRGHGALYDALAAGRIDEEAFAGLLTATLPQLADGAAARGWIAAHDTTDHGLLERALAGLPPVQAAQVRDACARWRRLRFAIDATPYPRPDAECSPGREQVHHDACRCDGTRKTIPGWEYQFTAAIGHLRTAWAALIDVERTTPATRTRQTIRQVTNLLRRLHAAGNGGTAVPLVIFDAGYSAAALTAALAGAPVHLLVRLPARSVFYYDTATWPGKRGRPGKYGTRVACRKADDPDQSNPEPDESLVLPGTPRYGTVRVDAWRAVHPLIHGDRGYFAGWDGALPVLPGTVLRVTVDHLPGGREPLKAMWLWHAGPGPLSADELWRAYLARFDEEHAFKFAKGTLGLTAAKVRTPEQAGRWVRLVMAAYAQLLLARPLAADLRRPWERRPGPARPLPPGRVRRGFTDIRPRLGTPARVAKPARPGPGRPKGSASGPAPRHPVLAKTAATTASKPKTAPKKVKT
jgi:DDE superfamily endonuclease